MKGEEGIYIQSFHRKPSVDHEGWIEYDFDGVRIVLHISEKTKLGSKSEVNKMCDAIT
jgi:ATP-dependent DNA ligase